MLCASSPPSGRVWAPEGRLPSSQEASVPRLLHKPSAIGLAAKPARPAHMQRAGHFAAEVRKVAMDETGMGKKVGAFRASKPFDKVRSIGKKNFAMLANLSCAKHRSFGCRIAQGFDSLR